MGRHPIGRIGGLAAALGVGAVLFAAPANAESDSTASSPPTPQTRLRAAADATLPSRQAAAVKSSTRQPSDAGTEKSATRVKVSSERGSLAPGQIAWTPAASAQRGLNAHAAGQVNSPQAKAVANAESAPSVGDILNYTLFHKSATARPEQTSGQSATGVVTGNLNASSPNGANITYTVAGPPENGSVVLRPDGSYTYTPGLQTALSGGNDTFSVTIDNGSAYRLTGIEGAIQGIFMALAQVIGLRQPDMITVQVPVAVASTIVTIPIGATPFDVAVSPDGRFVYASTYDDNAIAVVDTATGTKVRAISFTQSPLCSDRCKGPTSLAISADGSRLYAVGGVTPVATSNGTLNYFAAGSPLTVIDTATGLVIDRIEDPWSDGDVAISPDGTKVYLGVNGWGQGQPDGLRVVDLATRTYTYLGVTSYVIGLSPDGETIALIDWNGDSAVHTFEVATNTEIWSTSIKSSGTNYYGDGITMSNDRVYVSVKGTLYDLKTGVAVLDVTTGSLVALIETGKDEDYDQSSFGGIAASPDGKRIYVANSGQATLSVIDATTNSLIATVNLGGYPWGIATSPDGKYVYITNRTAGTLSVIPV